MVNNLTKVFIKITSWLLGRPSGTPDMVFGVKDGAIVKGVFMSQSIPVLEELPDADASKAGQQFWLNGTLWTYARAGQFGTLPVGTPWPVKGYKEFIFSLNSGTESFFNIVLNEIFVSLPAVTDRFSNVRTFILPSGLGVFTISSNGYVQPSASGSPTTTQAAVALSHIDTNTNTVSISAMLVNYESNEIASFSQFGQYSLKLYPTTA